MIDFVMKVEWGLEIQLKMRRVNEEYKKINYGRIITIRFLILLKILILDEKTLSYFTTKPL